MLRVALKSESTVAGAIKRIVTDGIIYYSGVKKKSDVYAQTFAKLVSPRKEFFLFWCRDVKSNKDTVIDVFYPRQSVDGTSVGAASSLDEMLSDGLVPVSLYHSHHDMNAFQSGMDLTSLKEFTDDMSQFNSLVFLKEEPLIRMYGFNRLPGEVRIGNKPGTMYVSINPHDGDSDENIAAFRNLLMRSRLLIGTEHIRYGYSVVTNSRGEVDVALLLKYMCNTCESQLKFPPDALKALQSHIYTKYNLDSSAISQGYALMSSQSRIFENKPINIDLKHIENDIRNKTIKRGLF